MNIREKFKAKMAGAQFAEILLVNKKKGVQCHVMYVLSVVISN